MPMIEAGEKVSVRCLHKEYDTHNDIHKINVCMQERGEGESGFNCHSTLKPTWHACPATPSSYNVSSDSKLEFYEHTHIT